MADKLTLADINEALNHQITGGSAYQWSCYGLDARYIDYTISGTDVTATVIYDTETQEVYQAELCDEPNDLAYRWSNPDYHRLYHREAKKRGVNPNQAWDNLEFSDVSVDEWIQTALELMSQRPVQEEHLDFKETTDTTVELNLADTELLQLCLMAHERDITLNKLVNNILREYIDNYGTL